MIIKIPVSLHHQKLISPIYTVSLLFVLSSPKFGQNFRTWTWQKIQISFLVESYEKVMPTCISWCSNRLKNGPYPNCQLRFICFIRANVVKIIKKQSNPTQCIQYKANIKIFSGEKHSCCWRSFFSFPLNTDKPGIILQNGASSTSKSTLQIHFF